MRRLRCRRCSAVRSSRGAVRVSQYRLLLTGSGLALCVVFGATAIGWNGVYIAEIARIAPAGNVALVTGASIAFTYVGVVVMPVLFWVIVAVSAGYTIAFNAAGALTLLAGLSYFRGGCRAAQRLSK